MQQQRQGQKQVLRLRPSGFAQDDKAFWGRMTKAFMQITGLFNEKRERGLR
jgi:hypothetical protein